MVKKPQRVPLTNTQIRRLMLNYFYERNKNATSSRGKRGSAVKISDAKRELKATHDLTQQEVQSNLRYLLSEGWVEEATVEKSFTAPGGTVIPSTTNYYQITARGIDKIEGQGEFTMPKFEGININATGHNIITLGDGNQIKAEFSDLGEALVNLRGAIIGAGISDETKMSLVADIDTIESQLAKPTPNRQIIAAAWETVKTAATIDGGVELVNKVAALIAPFIS